MNTAIFTDLEALLSAPPRSLGTSGWVAVTGEELSRFEQAVGGPVSAYLALSLTNRFLPGLLQVPAASSGVNYGAESVRFGRPLEVGDRVRVSADLVAASEVRGGVQTTVEITVTIEGEDEPACIVRSLSRWLS